MTPTIASLVASEAAFSAAWAAAAACARAWASAWAAAAACACWLSAASCLHLAAVLGHLEIIKWYEEELSCSNINPIDNKGNTPLSQAIKLENLDVVEYLIMRVILKN